MPRILRALMVGVLFILPVANAAPAPRPDQETKELKKRHKAEKKQAKQQQRAMKNVMAQHECGFRGIVMAIPKGS
jgi:hypothetical protein